MKAEQIREITEKATEQLVAALDQGHSETLTAYLKAIGRFHRYSLHNVMLIALQKPNASHVAGFRTWNQLGRFVKKGEKGIVILAPVLRRKEKENEEPAETTPAVAGFRSAYVFDTPKPTARNFRPLEPFRAIPRIAPFGSRHSRRRREFRSNIRTRSLPRVASPMVGESHSCPARHRPRSFPP
jgi:hypothetical protein